MPSPSPDNTPAFIIQENHPEPNPKNCILLTPWEKISLKLKLDLGFTLKKFCRWHCELSRVLQPCSSISNLCLSPFPLCVAKKSWSNFWFRSDYLCGRSTYTNNIWNKTTWKKLPKGSKIDTCAKLHKYLDPCVVDELLVAWIIILFVSLSLKMFSNNGAFLAFWRTHIYIANEPSSITWLGSANSFRYSYTSCSRNFKKDP